MATCNFCNTSMTEITDELEKETWHITEGFTGYKCLTCGSVKTEVTP